jgi:hypothetical protein
MLADPLGPPACRLRVRGLSFCGACVDLVGVHAHGRRGIATIEFGEETLGVAFVGIFEGTSEMQRLIIGRAVTGLDVR